MTSGLRSVAFVVRLKSIALPSSAARAVAYATAVFSTVKFISVSPPKNVRCATRPDSRNRKSTLSRAVSSLIHFGWRPFSVWTILSSPYS